MRAAPTTLPAVQSIQFHEDTISTVRIGEEVRVAIKPITERLGLKWTNQLQSIKRDPVLRQGVMISIIPSPGGPQEMVTLPLEFLNGWLFKVNAGRYKPDDPRREVIIRYQRECFQALYAYWHQGAAVNPRAGDTHPEAGGDEEARTSLRLRAELRELSERLARIESRVEGAEALPPALPGGPSNALAVRDVSLDAPEAGTEHANPKLRYLLDVWWEAFGPKGATIAQAAGAALQNRRGWLWNVLKSIAGDKQGIDERRLGRWISKHAKHTADGARMVRVGHYYAHPIWAVQRPQASVPGCLEGSFTVQCSERPPVRGLLLMPLSHLAAGGPPINRKALAEPELRERTELGTVVDLFLQVRVIDAGRLGQKITAENLLEDFRNWTGLHSFPSRVLGMEMRETSYLIVYRWRGAKGSRIAYLFAASGIQGEVAR